jgi:AcrR family transcriptional regulator
MAKPDPAHTIRLLWRAVDGPARGPKPGLALDGIVDAAVALADADGGLAKLSMRRVGEALGVSTMSLYTYVPGKADLLALMQDRVMAEVAELPPLPAGWRPALTQVAEDNRALFERHPWVVDLLSARPPLGPGVLAKYERELGAVDGAGLSAVEMDGALSLVLRHVASSVSLTAAAAREQAETGLDDMAWWGIVGPVLDEVVTETYPVADRVGSESSMAYEGVDQADRGLAFGLARILDGIEALISARRAP